jgi:hypothetical protein
MTKEQTREAIEIMLGWVNGKIVEVRSAHTPHGDWTELRISTPSWNWEYNNYRIKPEPMEVYVWVNEMGDKDIYPDFGKHTWTKHKFREVLE